MSCSPTRKRNRLLPNSGAIPTLMLRAGFSLSLYPSEMTVDPSSLSTLTSAVYGVVLAAVCSVVELFDCSLVIWQNRPLIDNVASYYHQTYHYFIVLNGI